MDTTAWLRNQVARLSKQISLSPVFDSHEAPMPDELHELRRITTIYRFLEQELRRREARARVRTREEALVVRVLAKC